MAAHTLIIFSGSAALSSSTDGGATWTARTIPVSPVAMMSFKGADHNGSGRWIVHGRNNSGNPAFAYSDDTVTWTTVNSAHTTLLPVIPDTGLKYCNFSGTPLWVYVGSRTGGTQLWVGIIGTSSNGATWTSRTASPFTAGTNYMIDAIDCNAGTALAVGRDLTNNKLFLISSTNGTTWTDVSSVLSTELKTNGFLTDMDFYGPTPTWTGADPKWKPVPVIQFNRYLQRWQIIVIYPYSLRVFETASSSPSGTYTEVATVTRDYTNLPTFIDPEINYMFGLGYGGFVRSTRYAPTLLAGMMSYSCRQWVPIINYREHVGVNIASDQLVSMTTLANADHVVVGFDTDGSGAKFALTDSLHGSLSWSTTGVPSTGVITMGVAYSYSNDVPCAPIIVVPRAPVAAGLVSSVPLVTSTVSSFSPTRKFGESISDSSTATLGIALQAGFAISSAAIATDAASMQAFWHLASAATGSDAVTAQMTLAGLIEDTATASDSLSWGWLETLADSALASDSTAMVLTMYESLTESLLATGTITSSAVFNEALGVVVVASDSLTFAFAHNLSDAATATDLITALRTSLLSLTDSATATDTAAMTRVVPVVLTENLVATDALTVSMVIRETLSSTATAHFFIDVGNSIYDAWTMNTESLGATEYTNFPFSSFGRFNDQYYATGDDGIYLLEGDDDAGTAIDATIRTGIESLGTEFMKSIPNVYVGYKSDGQMVLKTVTTNAGVKKENWYALNAVQKDVTSDNRFSIAKGVHSVYWQFELSNYEGSDFELESIKLWRLVLSRRK